MTPERAGELAEQAGMVNLFFHGAASMVFTHGVGGVTQEQLMKFANLCCAEERADVLKNEFICARCQLRQDSTRETKHEF